MWPTGAAGLLFLVGKKGGGKQLNIAVLVLVDRVSGGVFCTVTN